jgi:hypothetical protein
MEEYYPSKSLLTDIGAGLRDEKQEEEMLKSVHLDRDYHLKLGELNLGRESFILLYITIG